MNYHKRYAQLLGINVTKHIIFDLMRSFALFIALGLTTLLAKEGNAQTKMTIQLQEAPLETLFEEIQNNSEYIFFYMDGVVPKNKKVTVNEINAPINTILDPVLKNLGLGYKVQDRQVILFKAPPIQTRESTETAENQDFSVSGTVTDESGMPLPGTSIVEKGTTNGTQTDFDGNFALTLSDSNATLVVSYIGFASKEVAVAGQSELNIVLQESAAALDEIVVIGYGSVKKSDLTGAVSSLKSEDMNPGANASVDQMLQGRAAGVQISQSSSEPGGGLSIRVRGASSINAGNEPLYVIDGFPIDNSSNLSGAGLSSSPEDAVGGGIAGGAIGNNISPRNPLNSLSPSDIESIEILKDASATAIYGSRGANGVVLITTKKGRSDKMSIGYNTYAGIQSIAKRMDVLSTSEYIDFMNDVASDRGQTPVFSESDINAIGSGTDWQDQIFQSALVTDHNLSVSGGVGKSKVYASLNYFKQDGIVKNTGIEKYIARLNFDTTVGENLDLGLNMNASRIDDRYGLDGVNTNESAGPIYSSLLYDPTEPIYNPDGTLAQSASLTINNPVTLIEGITSTGRTNRILANFYLNYKFFEGFSAKLNLGADTQNMRRNTYVSTLTLRGQPQGGVADVTSLERDSYLMEYTMNYNKEFNENHRIDLLGGVTYQKFNNYVFNGTISGFPSDDLETNNLELGDTNNDNLYSNKEDNSLFSYLGRINYTLLDKFLFTASIRADGSSRFGTNNKYGYFPSFAFGYKLSEEPFIPEIFDELKFRGSWGQTGNQDIANYASQLTFGTGGLVSFDGASQNSVRPLRIANPDLKWETTTQFNVGIDASIFNGRISTTLDYYKKNTTDLLFNLPLPRASGYQSILSNVGEVTNEGFELLINSTNISSEDFSWSTSLNFATVKNEVVDLGRVDQIVTGNIQATGNAAIIRVGSPLASYYGFEIDGIQQVGDSNPGFPNVVDQNDDGVITPEDQIILGDPFPDFTYGISNEFKYKNLGLSFFFQGVEGQDLLNVNVIESMYPSNDRRNRLSMMADRWTPNNPNAAWPSATDPNSYAGGKVNSLTVLDASYLRLKNVQLSYDVPMDNIKFMNSLRLYVTGQNLFTITDYVGYDPEANSFGRSNIKVDYSSYPLARTFIFGLNATF
ncbi:TonB-dependent receptor [Flagellimonas aurea]|uniref:TonB-dependent receptor n=1 Tax=Flagellimonas aurea TaxID=2915619 RepID=UPI0035D0119E